MVVSLLKLALFAAAWLAGRSALRALAARGGIGGRRARLALVVALVAVIGLFWYPELRWAAAHAAEVGRGLGVLALTALPVAGFVLYLRWAHRRAARGRGEDGEGT